MTEPNTIRAEGLRLRAIWQDVEQNTTTLRYMNEVDAAGLDVVYDGLLIDDRPFVMAARLAPLRAGAPTGPDTIDSDQMKQLIADTKVNE